MDEDPDGPDGPGGLRLHDWAENNPWVAESRDRSDAARLSRLAQLAPSEAEAFRGLLRTAARDAADAAKENGFLGFGGEQVSARETEMLAQIDAAIAAPAA